MFTGIVTHVGNIIAVADPPHHRICITCPTAGAPAAVGASISCAGICLTATAIERTGDTTSFWVDIATETSARTTVAHWTPGRHINLERPLRVGDELGGHLVTGHVDGTAELRWRRPTETGERFGFQANTALLPFIAEKGSVALDGVSLTVASVNGTEFEISVIPHTLTATTIGELGAHDAVNIEIDTLARYVARIQEISHARS